MRRTHVAISEIVGVGLDAWAEAYGLDPSDPAAIRQDVKAHAANLLAEAITFSEEYGTGERL